MVKFFLTLNVFLLSVLPAMADNEKMPAAIETIQGEDPDDTDKIKLYKDLDEDAVKDELDHCDNSKNKMVDRYGCQLDSDGDGIFDTTDQCPNTPMDRKVNFLGCQQDTDKDGVIDYADQCTKTPLGSLVNSDGCKLENDLDGDGIPDSLDQCPNSPKGETVNQFGCVPRIKVVINVTFPPNSANIPSTQKPTLERDVSKLKKLKAEEVILITGHTDYQGSAINNLKLSWARAQSVKDYVIDYLAMNGAKIYLLGEGESKPIANNLTAEGRQKNRRIEFEIINIKNLPPKAQTESPPEMTWINR